MEVFCHKRTGRHINISEYGSSIGRIFNLQSDDCEFLEEMRSKFDSFERSFTQVNETYWNDINYIIQCTTESLVSSANETRFHKRIDAYFYIYNRVEHYSSRKRPLNNILSSDTTDIDQLRNDFLAKIAYTFTSTRGAEPNLCTINIDLLKSLNIPRYLSFVPNIDNQSIHLFFALCKLAFQSSLICHCQGDVQWKNILTGKAFTVSLEYFVSYYNSYKDVFQKFPLDSQAFVHLIETIYPNRQSQPSRLTPYYGTACSLNLNIPKFFELFQKIFRTGVIYSCYNCRDMAQFMYITSQNSFTFSSYLALYYTNLPEPKVDIWNVFFILSEKYLINEIIVDHFSLQLAVHVQKMSINEFLQRIDEIKKHLNDIKGENYAYYERIMESIFEAFIKHLLSHEKHSGRLSDANLEELLKSSIELSKIRVLPQPSSLLIIQRLLFQHNDRTITKTNRMDTLFHKLRIFGQDPYQTNVPDNIIHDEWLEDFLIDIPQEFCAWLTYPTYRNLCENYKTNLWAHFIWSRIINLSLLKIKSPNSNNTLMKLNQWMVYVKHDVFRIDDALTITFIKHLFDLIIKDTKYMLLLPDISCIIDFIFHMRKENIYGINGQAMNEFIQNGQREIYEILLLKGKLKLCRVILRVCS